MPITGTPPSAGGFYDAYICVQDEKAQNTSGGTFTSNAWRTRDINEKQADTANICSITSNQITLAAGTYRCLISAPARRVNKHQTRLYNATDATAILTGTPETSNNTDNTQTRSFIAGRFTLSAQKTLEVQHYCTTTANNDGFGLATNSTTEIYTIAEFWREA